MMKKLAGKVVVVLVLLAVVVTSVLAQVPTGTIDGIVSDPHEAVIPKAHVVAASKTQGISRETSSNADGLYVFANVPAGAYDLKIEASGFAPSEFTEAVVQAGRTTTLDAKLQVAAVGTTISVNEAAGEIDPDAIHDSGPGHIHHYSEHSPQRQKLSRACLSDSWQSPRADI